MPAGAGHGVGARNVHAALRPHTKSDTSATHQPHISHIRLYLVNSGPCMAASLACRNTAASDHSVLRPRPLWRCGSRDTSQRQSNTVYLGRYPEEKATNGMPPPRLCRCL
eukprot:362971-Chlamydomonas_euryale.AAC.1